MSTLLNRRVTIVWCVLVAVTLISAWVGIDYGAEAQKFIATAVILLAFIKIRMVGMYFMELRWAPTKLRALFEIWCTGTCGIIAAVFLAA